MGLLRYTGPPCQALRFDGSAARLEDVPLPERQGEALIRVTAVGVCNTDLEIVRGYAGFRGTLGHEFVGVVERSDDSSIVGRRVVGEINCGCGRCDLCVAGDPRHCASRTVLGIVGRDGAMAEFVSLPPQNLLEVPAAIADDEAVFVEPLAAACEILDQVTIDAEQSLAVVGDGKLGLLIAQVLATTGARVSAFGRHESKLRLLSGLGIATHANADAAAHARTFDIVVEASGSGAGFAFAQRLVRPRGTIVLKSTIHGDVPFDATSLIVDEVTLVGSRCGRFAAALDLLSRGAVDVRSMIARHMALETGADVLDAAAAPGVLKVIVHPNGR